MGCGSSTSDSDRENDDKNHPDNKILEHEGWNDLKEKPRQCTDTLFLLLIIAVWVAMTLVGFIVTGVIEDDHLQKGDPARLTNAIDYDGNICGNQANVKSKPFAYYLPDTSVVCVSSCPGANNYNEFICQYDVQAAADASVIDAWTYVSEYKCMYEIKTSVVLNRCFPDTNIADSLLGAEASANSSDATISLSSIPSYKNGGDDEDEWYITFVASLYDLRGYVFGFGLGVSVAVSFLYLYLLRLPGLLFTVIWGAIAVIGLCLFVGSWLLWDLSNQWEDEPGRSHTEVIAMEVFAWFGIILSIVYVLVMIVLRSRIMLAIGIIKEASRAMTSMPIIVFLPVVQAVGITCFLVVWVIYILYLASSGEVVVETYEVDDLTVSYKSFEYTQNTKFAFLFMLFCWFWTSEFVLAFGQLVIALSFACWYFTRSKEKSNFGSNTNVFWAFQAAARYHLGTVAFGSLIIAIIKTIRAIVAYIQKKAAKSGNQIAQYVLCAIQCCLWCVEKCMKFLNKHAYILTAIYGYTFCKAARNAFFLLLRNILRVVAVNMVSSVILVIGKFITPAVTTFICYICIAYFANLDGSWGIVAPLVFVFVLSYWIAGMFSELFGMGIETILFCFIADEEMFAVADRFADHDLKSTMQKTAEKHKEQEEKRLKKQGQVHPDDTQTYSSPPETPPRQEACAPAGEANF